MTCAKGFQSHVICNCERQAGDPIPTQAIRDLIQRMIADGRPIEEQCTVQILPPLIIQADHKDTTEPHEH